MPEKRGEISPKRSKQKDRGGIRLMTLLKTYRCDRCKKITHSPRIPSVIYLDNQEDKEGEKTDLCMSCEEIINFCLGSQDQEKIDEFIRTKIVEG